MIPSVNYHLWEPCNMRCKFCFATFQDVKNTILPKGHLSKEDSIKIVKKLASYGFEKITFAGGEPTLCPWLDILIKVAKENGMVTAIVTNGSKLTKKFLEKNENYLDWIALSIDSIESSTNLATGRAIAGSKSLTLEFYKEIINNINSMGYGLKINTVVNKTNFEQDLSNLIKYARPKRWKVFQVLPIKGQNDIGIDMYKINLSEFNYFVNNHFHLNQITKLIPETNNNLNGSYIMVDPAGRFYDNVNGQYHYSDPILNDGVEISLNQIKFDLKKFIERGGLYNWDLKSSKF